MGKEIRIKGKRCLFLSQGAVFGASSLVRFDSPQGFEGVCLGADSFLTSSTPVWSVCQSVDNK